MILLLPRGVTSGKCFSNSKMSLALLMKTEGIHRIPYRAIHINQKRFWLDVLPVDLCQQVAMHVCNGNQTTDALRLALTSERQRRAVLSVLSNRLVVTCSKTSGDTWFWPWLCANASIRLDFRRIEGHPLDDNVLSLLKGCSAAGLVTASAVIYDDAPFLDAVRGSSIADLEIVLRESSIYDVFEALDTIRGLKSLTLICQDIFGCCCPLLNVNFTPDDEPDFPICLQNLQSLHIMCFCTMRYPPMLRILPALRCVEELTLYEAPPLWMLRRLKRLRKVRLRQVGASRALVSELGESVIELCLPGDISDGQGLSCLEACRNLQVLVLGIKAGTEANLVKTLSNKADLKVLGLRWHEVVGREESGAHSYYNVWYPAAIPGVVLELVQFSGALEDLRLESVQIRLSELTMVLKKLGSRLKKLSISIGDQDEGPFGRMEAVMDAVAVHNKNLLALHITEGRPKIGPGQLPILSSQARSLKLKLQLLQRRLPALDTSNIWYVVDSMEQGCCRDTI